MNGKFRHYRLFTKEDDGVLPRGGATVYFDEVMPGSFRMGITFCSLLDNFSKKVGRGIAWERYKGEKCILITIPSDEFNDWLLSYLQTRFQKIQERHDRWPEGKFYEPRHKVSM